jgi:hypothetical protein
MGWTESPPYFTTATGTVADLANICLQNHWKPPPHRLEAQADTPPSVPPLASGQLDTRTAVAQPVNIPFRRHNRKPLANMDVFVDNFIGMCQGPSAKRTKVCCIMLHSLDEIFHPLLPGDNPFQKELASEKSLPKVMALGKQGNWYWGG